MADATPSFTAASFNAQLPRDPKTGLAIGTIDPNTINKLPPPNSQLPKDPINALAIGGIVDPNQLTPPAPIVQEGTRFGGPIVFNSYSGADIVATVTIPGEIPMVVGELQTISYSIHRENTPVRFVGHTNVMGFVRGPRTIAGSLIFTAFDQYAFNRLNQFAAARFIGVSPLADMLPPFDVTLTFSNEYGSFSKMRIMGVTIVDEGGTMSIDDMLTEQTYTYMARGIVPLTAYQPPEANVKATKTIF